MVYSATVEERLVVTTMKEIVKRRFLVILSDGNPLGSLISSSLVVFREKLMWSGFMKKSSIQEEDFQSHCLFVCCVYKIVRNFCQGAKYPL